MGRGRVGSGEREGGLGELYGSRAVEQDATRVGRDSAAGGL